MKNVTLTFVANIYFLTFHVAFKPGIRGEDCICSGTAVLCREHFEMYLELNS